MKRSIFPVLLLFSLALTAQGQEIQRVDSDFSDYVPLLKNAGYEVFSYDISSLKDSTYGITFIAKEYLNGNLIEGRLSGFTPMFTNRRMLSVYSEEDQKRIIKNGSAYDVEKGIYKLSNKITFGFYATVDSVKNVLIDVKNMGSFVLPLALRPMDAPGFEGAYRYDIRPFEMEEIKVGEFIPLLLVGSFWWDERFNIIRFCGEREFSPSMQSETLDRIPHYFVIGISLSL